MVVCILLPLLSSPVRIMELSENAPGAYICSGFWRVRIFPPIDTKLRTGEVRDFGGTAAGQIGRMLVALVPRGHNASPRQLRNFGDWLAIRAPSTSTNSKRLAARSLGLLLFSCINCGIGYGRYELRHRRAIRAYFRHPTFASPCWRTSAPSRCRRTSLHRSCIPPSQSSPSVCPVAVSRASACRATTATRMATPPQTAARA